MFLSMRLDIIIEKSRFFFQKKSFAKNNTIQNPLFHSTTNIVNEMWCFIRKKLNSNLFV